MLSEEVCNMTLLCVLGGLQQLRRANTTTQSGTRNRLPEQLQSNSNRRIRAWWLLRRHPLMDSDVSTDLLSWGLPSACWGSIGGFTGVMIWLAHFCPELHSVVNSELHIRMAFSTCTILQPLLHRSWAVLQLRRWIPQTSFESLI